VSAPAVPRRLAGSGEDVGRGLGRLVVTLLEVVRQVVERQAIMQLEDTFDELIDHFGVVPHDLYLPLDLTGLDRLVDPTRRTP
jgi:hypothetical protein